jgi:lipoprotein-anchoring transpeptidase ErfK/SrfK
LTWGGSSPLLSPVQADDIYTEEIAYLSQSTERWIEVDLTFRTLTAWEGSIPIYSVDVSTGTDDDPTYEGIYAVQLMFPEARMEGEGADGKPYDIKDVPYVLYYDGSYAIHGAYWHETFGYTITHGCVNVPVEDAAWLYHWAGVGTPIVIHW